MYRSTATAAPPGTAAPPLIPPQPGPQRSPSAPPALGGLSDAALIDAAVQAQVMENASRARRLSAIVAFHQRMEANGGQRSGDGPAYFVLTPLRATSSEFSAALSVSDMTVGINLDVTAKLMAWFSNVWAMCVSGRLDVGRAEILLEAVSEFAHEEDIAAFAALMDAYIAKTDDPDSPICTVTRTQLQRAARYRKAKFEQKSEDESFAAAFTKRRLSFRPDENGIGSLSMRTMVSDAMTADYRVTLIAKQIQKQNPDETRTLEQIRCDVAMDLLLGRLDVSSTLARLEAAAEEDDLDDDSGDGDGGWNADAGGSGAAGTPPGDLLKYHQTGAYARPVINVTVPITTLLGLSEDPGLLSGGTVIPAELARIIAANPDSTWYRMLTDPARGCVELSTGSYQPTRRIWRQVVARDQVCYWPTCNRPAVRVELDHLHEWPAGETSSDNLGPGCKAHHTVKHSKGFSIARNPDGSYTWTTPTGHTYTSRPPEQPVAEWPHPDTIETTYRELADTFL